MPTPNFVLSRGPVQLPNTTSQTLVTKEGLFSSSADYTKKAWVSLAVTGISGANSAHMTAQVTSDDGVTWTEVAGPFVSKTDYQAFGGVAAVHGTVFNDKIYILQRPDGSPAVLALYAFDLNVQTWSTVNASLCTFTVAPPGISSGLLVIFGINSNGYAVAYAGQVYSGSTPTQVYRIVTFNINGTLIDNGTVTDPNSGRTPYIFRGVKVDNSVLFTTPDLTGGATIFTYPDGATNAGCVITGSSSGSPLPDSTNDLYQNAQNPLAVSTLQKQTSVVGPYVATSMTVGSNYANIPGSVADFLLEVVAGKVFNGVNFTAFLDVSYKIGSASFSSPNRLFSNTVAPLQADTTQHSSGNIEASTTSGGHMSTMIYGLISNVPQAGTGPDTSVHLITSWYWQVTVTLPPDIAITCPTSSGIATVGIFFASNPPLVSNGTPPYTFVLLSGPGWMSINASTGVVSGVPTAVGAFTYTIQVTDSMAATVTTSPGCNITVVANPNTPALAPTNCPFNFGQVDAITLACPVFGGTAQVGVAYSNNMVVTGGVGPYNFMVTAGTLPAGLSLNSSTGLITGTPTTIANYPFTVQVVDNNGLSAFISCAINVISGSTLNVACPLSGAAIFGVPYSGTLIGSGGTGPYTYAKTAGAFPPGVTLSSNVISGTPTAIGTFDYTITITDSLSHTATSNCEIIVGPPPPPPPPPTP